MKINNFKKDLAKSQSPEIVELWNRIYHKWKPGCRVDRNDEYNLQQLEGIDTRIYLPNRKILRLDEKVRKVVYDDFALEDFSDIDNEKKGWMWKKLNIHFIAYLFKPTETAWFLPWKELQALWFKKRNSWFMEYYPPIVAKNIVDGHEYRTFSIGVPIPVLVKEIPTIEKVSLRS